MERKIPKKVDRKRFVRFIEHPCALFSYEDLEDGKLSLYGEEISGLTVYRGWMMKPEMYRDFYNKLEDKGIILINTPEEYTRYHTLPGWYEDFKDNTAESVWEDQGNIDSAMLLTRGLEGPHIVKNYVKSRKHEWYDACYINNIADQINTQKIIENFLERQGSSLVGGVVLRTFEKLKQVGFHEKSGMPISEEYRVFVFAGRIGIIDDYWQDGKTVMFNDEEYSWIKETAKKLKSTFVTMDIARREDGKLIIMELGDGQVSGLQQIKPKDFYYNFNQAAINLDDIPVEDFLPEGGVILAGDPMPDMTIENMKEIVASISSTQELDDCYVAVYNKFWYIEDDLYDYEKYTEEYERFRAIVDAWGELMDELDKRVLKAAEEEGLLAERQPDSGTVKQLKDFMEKYGYRDGAGWWVKCDTE